MHPLSQHRSLSVRSCLNYYNLPYNGSGEQYRIIFSTRSVFGKVRGITDEYHSPIPFYFIHSKIQTRPCVSPAINQRLSSERAKDRMAQSFQNSIWYFFVFKSQALMVWDDPEITCFPSGLTTTARTYPLRSFRLCSKLPLVISHTFTVSSFDPENSRSPSQLTARVLTFPIWPFRLRSNLPFFISHTLMILSLT